MKIVVSIMAKKTVRELESKGRTGKEGWRPRWEVIFAVRSMEAASECC
jgi:hypothetical protein